MKIYDYIGYVIYSDLDIRGQHFEFNLSEFSSGIYIVSMETDKSFKRIKVLKK